MTKYFVDTTVLTDVLLKTGSAVEHAKSVLPQLDTELPVFAIREFKAGPLQYYAYTHNKLLETKSFDRTLEAIQRLSRTPQRYRTSTALEALVNARRRSISGKVTSQIAAKYPATQVDVVEADEIRLALKLIVLGAWRKRREMTKSVTVPLVCYDEVKPEEKRGRIELAPTKCSPIGECALAALLKAEPDLLKRLWSANDELPDGREKTRRGQVLRNLVRKPKQPLDEQGCRNLGDALFAFFCPAGGTVLTTNLRDHDKLTKALGKKATSPADITT